MPLLASVGANASFVSAEPGIELPFGWSDVYLGSIDGEKVAVAADRDSTQNILELFLPGLLGSVNKNLATDLFLEYLAIRIMSCLGNSWTGPQGSTVEYKSPGKFSEITDAVGVMVTVSINGQRVKFFVACSEAYAAKFDGLWRRQLLSTNKGLERPADVGIEIAQLAVPPAMLVDYTRSGTIIDLEVALSDTVLLRNAGRPWVSARIGNCNGMLGIETISNSPPSAILPEGTTRLSVQFGNLTLDGPTMVELSQAGAAMVTDIDLNDQVQLVVNGERVADATLCTYEGRFAVSVN
jgi:hypothetical protein